MRQMQTPRQSRSFDGALKCLADLNIGYQESRIDDLCQTEELILRHEPSNLLEAAAILDMIRIQDGERSDGLDKRALWTVAHFLRRQRPASGVDAR